MPTPYLVKSLMPPEERAQYETGSAMRSLKRSHDKYRYRHLKAPTREADISNEDLANIAFDEAEKYGGTSGEIENKARSFYDYLKTEQTRRAAQQGRKTLKAVRAGAAERPSTVMATPKQAEAIPKGKWFLTEQQAKLRLAKSGAIAPEQIRHFMMGKYTPETKAKLERALATPQVGAPDKFEGEETSPLGGAVSTLFDILGTGGRAYASGKAAETKSLRESGDIEEIARGKQAPFIAFGGLADTVSGAFKGAIKSEDAPNLEEEIIRTKDYLINLAYDDAEKELPGFSDEDITTMARYKYKQFKKNLGLPAAFGLEHPSGVSTAYEIIADPLMYAGAAPYKLGAAAIGKAIPRAAKIGIAKGIAKVAGPVSYKAQFLALEMGGEKGQKLARGIRFAETNLGPGEAGKFERVWDEVYNLNKRVKKGDKELFYSVINKERPIEDLPEYLSGIYPRAKEISDVVFKLKVAAGSAQTIGKRSKVQPASYLKDYGTPQVLQEAGFESVAGRKGMFRGATTGSTRKRTGGGHPEKDFGKQWEATLSAEAKVAQAAVTYRGVREATEEAGAWKVFRPSEKGVSLKERIGEIAGDYTAIAGVKFVPLKEEISKKVLQVTSKPGTKIWKGSQIILPEPAAKAIERAAFISNPEQSFKSFGDLYKSTIRPLQNLWRINATILRSPQFLATNTVGAIGLGGLAHGIRALNPKLQKGAIATAALAAFGGSSKAMKTQFKLIDGEVKTFGELFNIMRDSGIIGQYRKRYALEMLGKGPLGKIEEQYRKIPGLGPTIGGKNISLQGLAAFGDEYQHSVAFLGALKSTSPDDIAKAADFTAQFAGNYNRLTQLEKVVFREMAGFYTWNRFILPHVTKQIFENPQRLLVYEKLKKGWEEYLGDNRPIFEAGVPQWMKFQTGATAPSWAQPESPHETAMMFMETPISTLGSLVDEGAVPFMLGPGAAATIEMITGIDLRTGKIKQDLMPYVPDVMEGYKGTGRELLEKALPFGEAISNMGRLYWNWGQYDRAAETYLRYKVARDWLNIDRLVTGQKPLGIPGLTKTFVFQQLKEAARNARKATRD